MPVLVTGVEHATGRAVAQRLAAAGGEVRVFLDLERPRPAAPQPWQRLGCKVAQGALDDEGHLETALAQVHTVLHLADTPLDDPQHTVAAGATVLTAALGAGCKRLIWLSHLGAAVGEANPWLAALGEVATLLEDAPLEVVVVRRAWTYGTDDALSAAVAAVAPLTGRHWALQAELLAAAVVHLDRERVTSSGEAHLDLAVCGPAPVTAADLAARLRSGGAAGGALTPAARELLERDQDPPPSALRLGSPHPDVRL